MTRRMFVYELPYTVRKQLCVILDTGNKWEELGGEHMGFDYLYLQYIRRKESPTDELLTVWGNQNHTVNDLFVLLSKMQHYWAMSVIKDLVQEKYHHLIREGEEQLSFKKTSGKETKSDQVKSEEQSRAGLSEAAGRLPITTSLNTFTDNKDLGFNQHNLNKPTTQIKNNTKKTVYEIKMKNFQNTDERIATTNGNDQNNILHEYKSFNANNNQQMLQSASQKPNQERKHSSVSVTSSVMESCTPQIPYEELEAATNYWDSGCEIGRGGFGVVYKGTWKNTLVAIKKLESEKDQQIKNSQSTIQPTTLVRELKSLNYHRHDNILSLYGYSVKDNFSCLVYQYMENGSLEDRLHCRKKTAPLNWAQRLNIMTGAARGIQFLHSLGNPPLVHGDIKSANILLDENLKPRLGDFGLSREGPGQQYTHLKLSRVHGTRPYLPDEFLRSKEFSVTVDTYSFGVVLFEVATGLRAYDQNRKEKFLKDHVERYSESKRELSLLADRLAGPDYCSSATGLLTVGLRCVIAQRRKRPHMSDVLQDVTTLHDIYKSAEQATCLALQCSLSPNSPLTLQVAHDCRHLTPSPTLPPHGSLAWPTPPHFPKGVGVVQILPTEQTCYPQQIMIHRPPHQVAVQQPPTSYSPTPQIDKWNQPEPSERNVQPVASSQIPLLTELLGKSNSEPNTATKECSPPQKDVSEPSMESSSSGDSLATVERGSSASLNLPDLQQLRASRSRELVNDTTSSKPLATVERGSSASLNLPDLQQLRASRSRELVNDTISSKPLASEYLPDLKQLQLSDHPQSTQN